MAKLIRPSSISVFASQALTPEITIFGSTTESKDIDLVLNGADAERGWGILGANGLPPMEWFNAIGYSLSYYSSYLAQQGIAEWVDKQPYYINSYAVGSNGKLYRSKSGIDGTPNLANDPTTDDTNWELPFAGVEDVISIGYFVKPVSGQAIFTKVSASSISIPAGTKVLVGSTLINVSSTITLSLNSTGMNIGLDTGAKVAGTDYSVYATGSGWVISASKTAPLGYTTANSKRIGGFHYGVIPEAFTAINNITSADATKIAGINQYSFWDLKFRPICDPSGMAYIFGRWYDLYLCNVDHHTYGTSAAGKTIAGGAVTNGRNYPKIPLFYGGDGSVTYGTFTWFEAAEIAKAHSKDLISYNEFVAIAYGVLEASSASTADTGITQHLANYTSKFGLCMATGCQYIWSKDTTAIVTSPAWSAVTEGRGSVYSNSSGVYSAILGGSRDYAVESGSRCSFWNKYLWATDWSVGCRYACNHLELA